MTRTINTPFVPLVGPCYYEGFATYKIPFCPIDPVTFADTEGHSSFYLAYHDQAGRVVRFDKLRRVWADKEPRIVALPTAREPGSAVYCAVVVDSPGSEAKVGQELEYAETEELDDFFAGNVLPSGLECKVRRFRREIAFTDTYAYWPNGRMRSRIKSGPDRETVEEYYDANGNKIAERIPYKWEEIIRQGVASLEAGDSAAAGTVFRDALHTAQREESLQGIAVSLARLARLDLIEGRHHDAMAKCELASSYSRAVENANKWNVRPTEDAATLVRQNGGHGNEAAALEALGRLADTLGNVCK